MTFESLFNELCETLKRADNLIKLTFLFSVQKSDLNRIKVLIDNKIDDYLKLPDILKPLKCEQTANKYREEGNVYFGKKKYSDSLTSYTKCVTTSPTSSQTIALGFGNRSAALFHLNEFEASIKDINIALQHSYSFKLVYKLLDRRGDCYNKLSDISNAKLSYTDALDSLQTSDLNPLELKSWTERCNKKLKSLSGRKSNERVDDTIDNATILEFDASDENVCLSNACCIQTTAERGRGIFSRRGIRPGEIILIEKPFSSILIPQHFLSHCQFCFRRCLSSVVCSKCTQVVFCDYKCRDLANKSFHHFECDILHYLDVLQLDKLAYLPLRTVIVNKMIHDLKIANLPTNSANKGNNLKCNINLNNHPNCKMNEAESNPHSVLSSKDATKMISCINKAESDNLPTMDAKIDKVDASLAAADTAEADAIMTFENENKTDLYKLLQKPNTFLAVVTDASNMSNSLVVKSLQSVDIDKTLRVVDMNKVETISRYTDILDLVTNADSRQSNDLFRRSILVLLLIKILEKCDNFFDDSTNHKIQIAGNLLSHVQSFPCNAHEVSELQLDYKDIKNSETVELGAAIYHNLSMFNHSCNPSVTRNFYGDICVMRAIATIPPHAEIFDNYGLHYAINSIIDRQTKLATQYLFKCTCEACINDWPTFATMCGKVLTWLCSSCSQPMKHWNEKDLSLMCNNCHNLNDISLKKQRLTTAAISFKQGFDLLLSSGKVELVEPKVCSYLQILFELVSEPWDEFCKAQEALKQCYNFYGNKAIITT